MNRIACVALLTISLSGCGGTITGGTAIGGTATGGTETSTPRKAYRLANSCVTLDGTRVKDRAVFENHCPFRVFVEWFDQGNCMTGCGAGPIAPGRSEIVTLKKASAEWAACESPGNIKAGNGNAAWNGGTFRCEG